MCLPLDDKSRKVRWWWLGEENGAEDAAQERGIYTHGSGLTQHDNWVDRVQRLTPGPIDMPQDVKAR